MTGYKNLFDFTAELGKSIGSLYKGSTNDNRNILEFMDANSWFGISYIMQNHKPMIAENNIEQIQESLTLWLSAYHKSGRDKTALLLKHFADIYPETCYLYERFIAYKNLNDDPATWRLLDFLFSELTKDITLYDESDIECMIQCIEVGATRAVACLFSDFVNTIKRDGKHLTQWKYSFNSRDNTMIINDAYSLEDFSVMAYCVFNEDMWSCQRLIEKAVDNKIYADLWLFVALHFVCALRSGDMERIPAPTLPYDGSVVFNKLANGQFGKNEASELVEELHIRMKLKPIKPSKTHTHENVPDIKLLIPESLKVPIGTILAIVLAHYPEIHAGDGFIKPFDRLSTMRDFFGEHFIKAIGNRRFSSRRCNKSYLQGLEVVGTDEPSRYGNPKGYMLATLARSHKSGIGKLAEATEIYLKDARFSGYNPKFIIKQMFERGVFSFIPAALLEIYAGDEYVKLPVNSQTKLIGTLGLSAYQIEGLSETVERTMIRSRAAVAEVTKNPSHIKKNVGEILQNIASGAAPGRQDGFLCLMTATGLSCPFSERNSCIGCGYEIHTKTTMYTLMREYVRLTELMKTASLVDANRYAKILEQAIIPAVSEILVFAKFYYPDADVSELLDIMEVEMNGTNSDDRGNENRIQSSNANS